MVRFSKLENLLCVSVNGLLNATKLWNFQIVGISKLWEFQIVGIPNCGNSKLRKF